MTDSIAPVFKRPVFARSFCILALTYFTFLLNIWIPVLRLSSTRLTVLFEYLFVLAPVVFLLLTLTFQERALKVAVALLLLPVLLLSLGYGFLRAFYVPEIFTTGHDRAFETLSVLQLSASEIVVHREDFGGALAEFRIDIRHEQQVFPGLLIVRRLYSARAIDADLHAQGDDHVRLDIYRSSRASPSPDQVLDIVIRRHVYL